MSLSSCMSISGIGGLAGCSVEMRVRPVSGSSRRRRDLPTLFGQDEDRAAVNEPNPDFRLLVAEHAPSLGGGVIAQGNELVEVPLALEEDCHLGFEATKSQRHANAGR